MSSALNIASAWGLKGQGADRKFPSFWERAESLLSLKPGLRGLPCLIPGCSGGTGRGSSGRALVGAQGNVAPSSLLSPHPVPAFSAAQVKAAPPRTGRPRGSRGVLGAKGEQGWATEEAAPAGVSSHLPLSAIIISILWMGE